MTKPINDLDSIRLILSSAPRQGSESDFPEGSRYITISDTLALKMIRTINKIIQETVNEEFNKTYGA